MELPQTVPYLDWRWDDLVFLLLAGVMLGSALLVVLGRDIIRSALWLILSFAALAGIYGLLGSAGELAAVIEMSAAGGDWYVARISTPVAMSRTSPTRSKVTATFIAGSVARVCSSTGLGAGFQA